MENNTIWEEKSYIEPKTNLKNNDELDQTDIMKNMGKKLENEISKDTLEISGIYIILNKVNNKYYVGSAHDIIGERWPDHKCKLRKNKHINKKLQLDWNIYGENNFEFHIIELVDRINNFPTEQQYLDWAFKNKDLIYNKNPHATHPPTLYGKENGFYGKTHTQENIKHFSKIKLGKHPSEETKRKTKESMKGKHVGENNPFYKKTHSTEKCQKWSEERKNSGNPRFKPTILHWFNKDLNLHEHCTQHDFYLKYKFNRGLISEVVNNKKQSVRGWTIVS